MMPRDYEGSKEFQDWWNANFDPSETGRARIIAAHAFDVGMATGVANVQQAVVDSASKYSESIKRSIFSV